MTELTTEFEGEEFTVHIRLDETGIHISNGEHGETYLSWADFSKVGLEVSLFNTARRHTPQQAAE